MTTPVLETTLDRAAEVRSVLRLSALYSPDAVFNRMPDFCFCDYAVTDKGRVVEFVEVKTRKEPHFVVMGYGGLMLKGRKVSEMTILSQSTGVPSSIVFAFHNGAGAYYRADPSSLTGKPGVVPPRRRNYRNLACDEEEVLMLDWDNDLTRVLDPTP